MEDLSLSEKELQDKFKGEKEGEKKEDKDVAKKKKEAVDKLLQNLKEQPLHGDSKSSVKVNYRRP